MQLIFPVAHYVRHREHRYSFSQELLMEDDSTGQGLSGIGGMGYSFLEQLAHLPPHLVGKKLEHKLPRGAGEKALCLQGTEEETARLCDYLTEQRVAMSALRITSRKTLSVAQWQPDLQIAQVTKQQGSHWMTHGHTHSGQLVLEPDEALFLMETGCLELTGGGLPMTIQQAYHTLLGNKTLTLPQYLALAHLKRAGYVVHRVHVSLHLPQPPSTTHQERRTLTGKEGQATPTTAGSRATQQPHNTLPHPLATEPASQPPSQPLCDPLSGHESLHPLPCCLLCAPAQSRRCGLQLLEVYHPRKGFQKTSPGPPDFRVWVCAPTDPFPSSNLLEQLGQVWPAVPLRCCVVDSSSVAFYTLTQGTLPTLT